MIFIPWRLYEIYGDDAYLSTHWDTMKLVLAALPYTNRFGDHLTETSTTGDVIRYAMAYRAAYIMKQAAIVLGDSAAETDADTAIASFSASFNALVSGGGATIGNNTHTCYALALGMPDLLPSGQRQTAVDALAASIISTGHITSGFLGINWIYDVLADNGYLDLAYTHTERTASPSLGYDISQGMTTLGERLGAMGYRNDGVHDDSNSMNHPSRCGMAGWFVRTVVGIDAYAPGFTTVLLRPRPGGTLTSADMTFDSPAGAISTSWALGAGSMTWDFTLPVDGVVVIPEGYLTSDLGAGTPMSADPITGGDRYSVPAGTYSITCYSAPVVTSNPTISPTGGSSTDTYTANDGAADYDTSHTRRWLLDGSPIGTGTTVVPGAEGELVLEVTWSGLGPDTVVTSAAATISDSWSPAQLPTGALVAEWDYAIAGNISHTAGSITQVNDNSGNGHHLTPTGGTVTYNATGGPDSAGSVSQLYTAGYLTASVPAASFPNGLLMLSVWKYTGPGFDEGILPMNRDGGGSGAAEVAGWGGTTRVCGDTTFGWAASSSAPDIKETAWNLHEAQGSTAGYFERKNCVQTFTMASPNYADNATGLRIGRNTHSGQMSMDLLYQCAVRLDLLGAGDLERLQAYPLWKRGLQSLLPAGHTYESSPP